MKKLTYIVSISLFTLIISIFLLFFKNVKVHADDNNPKIVFNEINHDFGKVKQGTEINYEYKFKNEGKGKLILTSVRPSCGCTGVTLDSKVEYEEGESGIIKISFNTQGRLGIQLKNVFVNTNDPINPQVNLSIRCEIEKDN